MLLGFVSGVGNRKTTPEKKSHYCTDALVDLLNTDYSLATQLLEWKWHSAMAGGGKIWRIWSVRAVSLVRRGGFDCDYRNKRSTRVVLVIIIGWYVTKVWRSKIEGQLHAFCASLHSLVHSATRGAVMYREFACSVKPPILCGFTKPKPSVMVVEWGDILSLFLENCIL